MARSDLILDLVKNSYNGNKYQFKKVVEAMIAEERSKQHTILAEKLQQELDVVMRSSNMGVCEKSASMTAPVVDNFLQEVTACKSFDDLVLTPSIRKVADELVEEHFRADILRSYGLEPRHKILLEGEPGTGKTSFAQALSERLMIPLYLVRYDALIGSYLGETAMRLRQLFDFVSSRKCVLFFDEFDTIGKERGDSHELGEVKRVVSSLLLMTDSLPSYTIIIGASNHAELLDRAVWRRFQVRMDFPMPDTSSIEKWLSLFEKKYNMSFKTNLFKLAEKLSGNNFGDVENFALAVMRRHVLSSPEDNISRHISEELDFVRRNITL